MTGQLNITVPISNESVVRLSETFHWLLEKSGCCIIASSVTPYTTPYGKFNKKFTVKMTAMKIIVPFLFIKLTGEAGLKMAMVCSSVKQTIIQELTKSPKCRPIMSTLQIKLYSPIRLCSDRRLTVQAGMPSAMVSEIASALRYIPPGSFLHRQPFVQTRKLKVLANMPQQMMRITINPQQKSKIPCRSFQNLVLACPQ